MKTSLNALILFAAFVLSVTSSAQQAPPKSLQFGPPKLALEPMLLDDSVVTQQWSHLLAQVDAPASRTELSPGQCIRIGIIATGDHTAAFLSQLQIGFTVHYAGQNTVLEPAAPIVFKDVKPEGTDLVQAALNAGGVKYQLPTSGTIAASAGKWCVPDDATAAQLTIDTSITLADKHPSVKSVTLPVASPENPGPSPLTDDKAVESWMTAYYRNPQPEFLVAFVPFIFAHDSAANIASQFVVTAMKRDPAAVSRLGPQLAKAEPQVQAMMVKLANQAGVAIKLPFELSPMQKEFIEKLPNIPDAFDLTPDQELFGKLDQLWSVFSATGDRAPVDTLIGMLAWRSDYDAFQKMQAEHEKPPALAPSIVRGVAYTAAGWSLFSFQRTDPLVADYIAASIADPKTPAAIQKELRELDSNPAFKQR